MSLPREENDKLLPMPFSGEEVKSSKFGTKSKLVVALVGAAALGGLALTNSSSKALSSPAMKKAKGANLASSTKAVKVTYGDMSDDEVVALYEKFLVDNNKPYRGDKAAKADRFTTFKQNLADIDKYNANNPLAVYTITNRADWTVEERTKMRGMKSSTLSKVSDETRSSWQILKDEYPDQTAIKLGEKGPTAVRTAAKTHATLGKSLYEVEGTEMSIGMFPWVSEDDCAACEMFEHFTDYDYDNLPTNFDWRELGAVGQVENQKYCGSCWSFSTAQDIAGSHFLAHGELKRLSEQQLVACDPGNDGCDGGWPFRAMQYIDEIGGMLHYDNMPYKGICAWDACDENPDGEYDATPTCDTEKINEEIEDKNVSSITGYQLVAMGAEYETLMQLALVKNGPLSVAFNAAGMDYYDHGIAGCDTGTEYTEAGCIADPTEYGTCDPTAIDHAVLVVGYGVQDDVDYWVIKNSWAEEWGEDGYYRLIRGVNMCGVANFVSHSVVKKIDPL